MCSGPVVVSVLAGREAIARYRTPWARPTREGRRRHHPQALCAEHRAELVHGSDAPETAAVEIAYFFNQLEIVG
jgi:nucleoside-diphosphate kinase